MGKILIAQLFALFAIVGSAAAASLSLFPPSGGITATDIYTLTIAGPDSTATYYLLWVLANDTVNIDNVSAAWGPEPWPLQDKNRINTNPPDINALAISPSSTHAFNCGSANCVGRANINVSRVGAYVRERLADGTTNLLSAFSTVTLPNLPPSVPDPNPPRLTPSQGDQSAVFSISRAYGSIDPETGELPDSAYSYRFKNGRGEVLQPYSTTSRAYTCSPVTCQVGDTIIAQARACDSAGLCAETFQSSGSRIGDTAPSITFTNVSEAVRAFEEGNSAPFPSGSSFFSVGWLSDWKITSLIAVMISALIVALAYMFGIGFGLREIKAWADLELGQVIGSVLIIAALIGFIAFVDGLSESIAHATMSVIYTGSICNGSEPCSMTVARYYLTELMNVATESAKSNLQSSVDYARSASTRIGVQTFMVYTLWAGGSYAPNAGQSMFVDRNNTLFDYHSKIIASLYAQRYFIDVITFGLAPLLLLVGILARTFFFTRKLGGLLLAIGVALLIVYPLTYIFSWLTLYVSVYGSNAFAAKGECPAECRSLPPIAFYTDSGGNLVKIYNVEELGLNGIDETTYASLLTPSPSDFHTCDSMQAETGIPDIDPASGAQVNACEGCDRECREIPYPSQNGACDEGACARCDKRCKVVRYRSDCNDENSANYCAPTGEGCPNTCRVILPMEGVAYAYLEIDPATGIAYDAVVPESRPPDEDTCESCVACPAFCRILNNDGSGNWLPSASPECSGCTLAACPSECRYKLDQALAGDCDQICGFQCKQWCRVLGADSPNLDVDGYYAQQCGACGTACISACKAQVPLPPSTEDCAPAPDSSAPADCSGCPLRCRWDDLDFAGCSDGMLAGYCGNSGCDPACRIDNQPKVCPALGDRIYKEGAVDTTALPYTQRNPQPAKCTQCPDNCRYKVTYANPSTGAEEYRGGGAECRAFNDECTRDSDAYGAFGASCSVMNATWPDPDTGICHTITNDPSPDPCKDFCNGLTCADSCVPVFTLPSNAACQPYDSAATDPTDCKMCPYWCRNTASAPLVECDIPECYADATSNPVILAGKSRSPPAYSLSSAAYPSGMSLAGGGMTMPLGGNCPNSCKLDISSYLSVPRVCSGYYGYLPLDASGDYSANDPGNEMISARPAPFNNPDSCKQCPLNCRIAGDTGNCNLPPTFYACGTADCPDSCRQMPPPTPAPPIVCADYVGDTPCFGCPLHCRIERQAEIRPLPFCANTTGCDLAACGDECRGKIPDAPCKGCFECDPDCTNIPTVRTNCAELCESDELQGPAKLTPASFINSIGGAEGQTDVKNLGILMIPAVILPLFNIVIILSFVRVLSPVLGGDIEIPGIARLI